MGAMVGKAQYKDRYWFSDDGLRLHYRDYAGPKGKPPILCIPGLTRNARDFEHVADRLAGEWRLICVDLRGRGDSANSPSGLSYTSLIYLQDLETLLSELKIKEFIAIGTSLGGLMTMMLAASKPGRVKAALINDIGPVIESVGMDRIRGIVGKAQNWPTWVHAARDLASVQRDIFPGYDLSQWIEMAKRLNRLTPAGRIVPAYDRKIAEPMRVAAEPVDLWPVYEALGDAPVTILRGALSDILSSATAKEMAKRLPNAKLVTVPGVGHAPALDEAASVRAIDVLLKAAAG
jgi:pimeloyl-ACP methyl ester carboxylesterase